MGSLRSFTCVSWGHFPSFIYIYFYIYRADLISVVFFLLSLFSKWNIYFFILVFSDPILFSLFLFLCSTFSLLPVFYHIFLTVLFIFLRIFFFVIIIFILPFFFCIFLFCSSYVLPFCYLFPFSLAAFFTKCEFLSFFTFQHMLGSVFWFYT